MIKRLPQEIADFTGCWVAQTPTGHWFIAKKRPLLRSYGWFIRIENRYDLPDGFVNVPEGHSWDHLYEPQGKEGKSEEDFPCSTETADSDNKQDAYSGKQADSDNKHQSDNTWETHEKTHGSTHEASHQSQVHVHQEYDVIYAEYPEQLSIKVTQLIHEGWKPVGGIVCLPPAHREDSETFYQAMVRGLE